jgi:hypothetical protein
MAAQAIPERIQSLHDDFVDKTPHPILARFERPHNRMMSSVKMLGGVFVLGGVATADMAAGETQAQMNPGVACF